MLRGVALGQARREQEALRLVEKALKGNNVLLHTHHMWHTAATVYTMLDMPAKAIPLLERCNKLGLPNYHLFTRDPHLAGLQKELRFQQLLTKMKREWNAFQKAFGAES